MAGIVNEVDAPEAIAQLKQKGFVVLCTGCFEVLHSGHVAFFRQGKNAKASAETFLVVGIENDNTLSSNKAEGGPPLFTQEERCKVVQQLADVDLVVRFDPL